MRRGAEGPYDIAHSSPPLPVSAQEAAAWTGDPGRGCARALGKRMRQNIAVLASASFPSDRVVAGPR